MHRDYIHTSFPDALPEMLELLYRPAEFQWKRALSLNVIFAYSYLFLHSIRKSPCLHVPLAAIRNTIYYLKRVIGAVPGVHNVQRRLRNPHMPIARQELPVVNGLYQIMNET